MMDLFLQTRNFSFHKTLNEGLELCGLLVDNCDVFISCLDSHSDGTHSLQRIHWWANYVMLNFSKSIMKNKQTNLHLGWPEGEYAAQKITLIRSLITTDVFLNPYGKDE